VYHPLTTLQNYAVYLKKFALFVKSNEYDIGDMLTIIPNSHFNDKTFAWFFYGKKTKGFDAVSENFSKIIEERGTETDSLVSSSF
jgi:hypothetical protein